MITDLLYYLLYIAIFILLKRYFSGARYKGHVDMTGKIVIITGASSGIGKETAIALAKMNATVIMACKPTPKSYRALEEVKSKSENDKVELMEIDLSSYALIRKFVETFKKKYSKLHVLINNAAIYFVTERKLTADGHEMQFGVNYLGHFLLTQLLLDVAKASESCRILNMTTFMHFGMPLDFNKLESEMYSPINAYLKSKLAMVMFTKELSKRLQGSNVTTNVINPGWTRTNLGSHLWKRWSLRLISLITYPVFWFFTKSARQGAQTVIFCAADPILDGISGRYFSDCKTKIPSKYALIESENEKLWDVSLKMTNLKGKKLE